MYLSDQVLRAKRFLEKDRVRMHGPMMDNGIIGIARHVESFHCRPLRRESFSQLPPTYFGHDDVGYQQMNVAAIPLAKELSLLTGLSLQASVALAFQDRCNHT